MAQRAVLDRLEAGGHSTRVPKRPPVLLLLAVLALAPASARGNPWDLFGAGSRGAGMGGAISTLSDDGFATFYNPAALTLNPAATLTVGYSGSVHFLDADVAEFIYPDGAPPFGIASDLDRAATLERIGEVVSEAADIASYGSLQLAATLPFRRLFPQLRRELTLGVSVSIPSAGAVVARVRSPAPDQPFMPVLGGWNRRLMTMIGIGGEILPGKLAAGVAILGMSDFGSELQVTVPVSTDGSAPAAFTQASGTQSFDTAVSVSAGLLWKPADWFTVAFTFRDEQVLQVSSRIDITTLAVASNGTMSPVTVPYTLESAAIFVPRQFLLGLSAQPHPRVTLALDLAYLQSSRLADASPIASFGVTEGEVLPGDVQAAPSPLVALEARDVFTVRAGVEVEAVRDAFDVRVGYSYLPRMLDGAQTNLLLDNDRHTVALGFTVRVGAGALRRLLIGGHFHALIQPEAEQVVAVPVAAGSQPVSGGKIVTSGISIGGGLTATFEF